MKTLFVVSTGRCGTTRLAEILSKYSAGKIKVVHQVQSSRISNVVGNILLIVGGGDFLRKWLIKKILPKDGRDFITTDPLVSLIIPKEMVLSKDVAIIHLIRERGSFATSFYQFTRKKRKSFMAHNFIPFWQPKVFLFENLIRGKGMEEKYKKIADYKEKVFEEKYSCNSHYMKIEMKEAFGNDYLIELISDFFKFSFEIPETEFEKKSNQSK